MPFFSRRRQEKPQEPALPAEPIPRQTHPVTLLSINTFDKPPPNVYAAVQYPSDALMNGMFDIPTSVALRLTPEAGVKVTAKYSAPKNSNSSLPSEGAAGVAVTKPDYTLFGKLSTKNDGRIRGQAEYRLNDYLSLFGKIGGSPLSAGTPSCLVGLKTYFEGDDTKKLYFGGSFGSRTGGGFQGQGWGLFRAGQVLVGGEATTLGSTPSTQAMDDFRVLVGYTNREDVTQVNDFTMDVAKWNKATHQHTPWEVHLTQVGKQYWWNRETKATSWTEPAAWKQVYTEMLKRKQATKDPEHFDILVRVKPGKEIVASYYHHLKMSDQHVQLGGEFIYQNPPTSLAAKSGAPPATRPVSVLRVAGSWQLNPYMFLKAKFGTDGGIFATIGRTMPGVTEMSFNFGCGYNVFTEKFKIGVRMNWSQV